MTLPAWLAFTSFLFFFFAILQLNLVNVLTLSWPFVWDTVSEMDIESSGYWMAASHSATQRTCAIFCDPNSRCQFQFMFNCDLLLLCVVIVVSFVSCYNSASFACSVPLTMWVSYCVWTVTWNNLITKQFVDVNVSALQSERNRWPFGVQLSHELWNSKNAYGYSGGQKAMRLWRVQP